MPFARAGRSPFTGCRRRPTTPRNIGLTQAAGWGDYLDYVTNRAVPDLEGRTALDVRKLRKCCVAEIVADGRVIPFCAYNSVGYREQVRAQLHAAGNGAG